MDLEYYKKLLHEKQAELSALDEASSDARKTVELDQTSVGRLSRMDALQGQAMHKAIAQRRQQALLRIKSALKRIAEDDYGYCFVCGEDISSERLKFDPAALNCAACATKK